MWLPITCPGWHIPSLWEERDDVTGHTHSQRVAHRMKHTRMHTHTRHTSFPSACFIFLNNVKDSFLLFTAWQRDLGCTLGPCNAVSPTRIHTFTCMQCPLPQVSPIKQMQRIPQHCMQSLGGACSHVIGFLGFMSNCFCFHVYIRPLYG